MKMLISAARVAARVAACASALAMCFPVALPANAQNAPIILRLGTIQAANNPIVAGMKRFAELVDSGTHGRVVVQTFDTGTLGAALPEIHNVRVGTQEMFADGCTWLGALIPDWNLCAIPYMNNNYTTAAQMMNGPIGQKLNQEFTEQQHIVVLANNWYRSVRELETTRPVNTPSELKDLKIRVPGMPDFVVPWQTYGANAVPLDLGQTFVALQQGVVVGTDTPLDITALFHFQEVEKYVSAINWLYEPIVLLINQDVWNRISKADQRVWSTLRMRLGNIRMILSYDNLTGMYDC